MIDVNIEMIVEECVEMLDMVDIYVNIYSLGIVYMI